MLLRGPYLARHEDNRMQHEGDVAGARAHFHSLRSHNLRYLLAHRYSWMQRYIRPGDRGIEVGAGTGLSREFLADADYLLTDFADHPWLDRVNVDALSTPFGDGELDFVVSSNMIHHVPFPMRFFSEMSRILKPGGHVLIQEINASLGMRMMLRLLRHEGYSFEAPVFDRNVVCTDPNDLWSANCAIPNLLFDRPEAFERQVPDFAVERNTFSEFLLFLNSGGVIAKTVYVPLPRWCLAAMRGVDAALTSLAPSLFALQRQIVLRKR